MFFQSIVALYFNSSDITNPILHCYYFCLSHGLKNNNKNKYYVLIHPIIMVDILYFFCIHSDFHLASFPSDKEFSLYFLLCGFAGDKFL